MDYKNNSDQYESEIFPKKIENNKFYLGLCKLNN